MDKSKWTSQKVKTDKSKRTRHFTWLVRLGIAYRLDRMDGSDRADHISVIFIIWGRRGEKKMCNAQISIKPISSVGRYNKVSPPLTLRPTNQVVCMGSSMDFIVILIWVDASQTNTLFKSRRLFVHTSTHSSPSGLASDLEAFSH